MGDLRKLPNIGRYAEDLLIKAGIDTPEKLMNTGSKEAFLKIKLQEPTACIRVLYGIEGAVRGIRDKDLSESTKRELKAFYNDLK